LRHDPDGRRGCGMGIGRRGEGISLMAFNPLDTLANQITSQKKDPNNPGRHTMPKYSPGARTLIRIGGKALGVALDFKWQVSAEATKIRTIDANLPWDLAPNQIEISGVLNQILDPLDSIEEYAIFSTMQAMVHQPY